MPTAFLTSEVLQAYLSSISGLGAETEADVVSAVDGVISRQVQAGDMLVMPGSRRLAVRLVLGLNELLSSVAASVLDGRRVKVSFFSTVQQMLDDEVKAGELVLLHAA